VLFVPAFFVVVQQVEERRRAKSRRIAVGTVEG